jgi:hypothetical protein
MPVGIGRKLSGCWNNIVSVGFGPTPVLLMNAISRRSNFYDKLLWKREAALESWALKIERHLSEVRNVWAFVSNHFEGFAPETAQRLAQRLSYELRLPSENEKVLSEQERAQLNLFAENDGEQIA